MDTALFKNVFLIIAFFFYVDKVETEIRKKNYAGALRSLIPLHERLQGKEKILSTITIIDCYVETKNIEKALNFSTELLLDLKLKRFELEKFEQRSLDECDCNIQKIFEKLKHVEDYKLAGLELTCCRFYILKHHSKQKTRLFKLGGLGKSLLVFAQHMGASNQEEFKSRYDLMDEILQEMQKIECSGSTKTDKSESNVNLVYKCQQVAFYLSQYGLCCTAIRDLAKSIDLHKRAISVMEFVLADKAGQYKTYGHCHCNSGSAFELMGKDKLEEAKNSYKKAVLAYKMVPGNGWKNNEEKKQTLSNAEMYLERVCDKLNP